MGIGRKQIEAQILCKLCQQWFPESKISEHRGLCPRCSIGARLESNQAALSIRRNRVAILEQERAALLQEEREINGN